VRSESLKIRTTPKLKAELTRLAKEAKRSVSDFVVLALEEYVEHAKKRK
jgi:predicted HicB family RNase H-like nuclease